MDITFSTKKLAALCNDAKAATTKLGPTEAKRLRRRLDDLAAAKDLSVMRTLPGRCHELTRDRKGQLSIDLEHPNRLIFVPTNDPIPIAIGGGLDWSAVTAIQIIEITDTHD